MKTEKLYDIDSYISEFTAKVVSCEKENGRFKIELDKTAFFPEAGGQPCDTGTINGFEALDVQIVRDVIYHYLEKEISVGETVSGKIDFERRFSFMQNHSGEHVVSGVVHKALGLDNVGFHLNEEFVTLDFNGVLDRQKLDKIENIANKKIWENNKVETYYPTAKELENLSFRQKKEIDGDIRIVDIKNTDICACCAPHVKNTGEIGLIKLLSFEKMRGGTRVYMKCGNLALDDYRNKLQNISAIQNLLSVRPNETANAVQNLYDKLNAEKQKVSALNKKLISYMVQTANENENCFFTDDFDMKDLQALADLLYKKQQKTVSVLSGKERDTYSFVICGEENEVNGCFKALREKLKLNGGGRNGMVQGTVFGSEKEIKEVFNKL